MSAATDITLHQEARAHRRRRVVLLVGLVALVGLAGLLGAAWAFSPATGDVVARVRTRVEGHHGSEVPLGRIAPELREAVVATEDERFFRHHGVDLIGVVRALAYDVSHLTLRQGASTITEQLAKDLYLGGDDHSVWRKLEDAAMALRIESGMTKEQIHDAYLNVAYFGHGAHGIGEAARRYFGVSPGRLTLSQSTVLAGLVQAPSADDPFGNPGAARARQADVLVAMLRNHDITGGEARRVLARPLPLTGGTVLPPARGVDVSLGQAFVGWQMATGVAFLVAGSIILVTMRRHRPALWRWAPAVGMVAGLLLVARSLRGD
jgi:membrane peptidoglycan carboxypeptidase